MKKIVDRKQAGYVGTQIIVPQAAMLYYLHLTRGMKIMEQLETRLNVPEFEAVPLYTDAHGVIRVKGTRVILDRVIHAYNEGIPAEQIVQQYTTLQLADVHTVIGYYLRHKDEVDAYLMKQEQLAAEFRREVEAEFPSDSIRERLLARMKNKD